MADTPPKTRRRWSFSLRALFVLVTVLAIPLGWVGYQLNWIRQRREVLRLQTETAWGGDARDPEPVAKPSWRVDWSGEEPVILILVGLGLPESEFLRIQALFPEADVVRDFNDESDKYYVFR